MSGGGNEGDWLNGDTIFGAFRLNEPAPERDESYLKWLNSPDNPLYDYPKTGADTPRDVFATAYYAYSTEILSKIANEIGNGRDAALYGKLAEQIKNVFMQNFVSDDAVIKGDTQTAYAMALQFDLLPSQFRGSAAKNLVDNLKRYGWRLSTGFHGTIYLMHALAETGNIDIAYKLLNNRTIPSWGFMIDNGATTMWERWDGFVPGRGFQAKRMNSFNHFAYGSIGEWIYKYIGGLHIDERCPGFKHFIVKPLPGGGITSASLKYDSINGQIEICWSIYKSQFKLFVRVPVNTTATVILPTSCSGTTDQNTFEISSGSHNFCTEIYENKSCERRPKSQKSFQANNI